MNPIEQLYNEYLEAEKQYKEAKKERTNYRWHNLGEYDNEIYQVYSRITNNKRKEMFRVRDQLHEALGKKIFKLSNGKYLQYQEDIESSNYDELVELEELV